MAVNLDCLDVWPSSFTSQEASSGVRVGVDYRLTNDGDTEQIVSVMGELAGQQASAASESVPANGTEYGTVFFDGVRVSDGDEPRIWIEGQEPVETGEVSLVGLSANRSTITEGQTLELTTDVRNTYPSPKFADVTFQFNGTRLGQQSVTLLETETHTETTSWSYTELADMGLTGTSGRVTATLSTDATAGTASKQTGTVTIESRPDRSGQVALLELTTDKGTIGPGESVEYAVRVQNGTTSPQDVTLSYRIAGNEFVTSSIEVAPGSTETDTYQLSYGLIEALYGNLLGTDAQTAVMMETDAPAGSTQAFGPMLFVLDFSGMAPTPSRSQSRSPIARAFNRFTGSHSGGTN